MTYSSVAVTSTETTLYESNFASSTDAEVHVALDVSAFQSGDTYVLRVYRKVDGTNYRLEDDETLSGAQSYPEVPVGPIWCNGDMDFKITAQKTAGTDRSIGVRRRAKF